MLSVLVSFCVISSSVSFFRIMSCSVSFFLVNNIIVLSYFVFFFFLDAPRSFSLRLVLNPFAILISVLSRVLLLLLVLSPYNVFLSYLSGQFLFPLALLCFVLFVLVASHSFLLCLFPFSFRQALSCLVLLSSVFSCPLSS